MTCWPLAPVVVVGGAVDEVVVAVVVVEVAVAVAVVAAAIHDLFSSKQFLTSGEEKTETLLF